MPTLVGPLNRASFRHWNMAVECLFGLLAFILTLVMFLNFKTEMFCKYNSKC